MKRIMVNVTENALKVLNDRRNTIPRMAFLNRLLKAIDAGKEKFCASAEGDGSKEDIEDLIDQMEQEGKENDT